MGRHHKLITSVLVFVSLLLTGCIKNEPQPSTLEAHLLTSIHVNPNALGKPSPIFVRYYELKSTATFENTDFFTLIDTDKNVLGADLLEMSEIELPPGTERVINLQLNPATRFIGVVAAYRELEQAKWRAMLPIKAHAHNAFVIRLGKATISVSDPSSIKTGSTNESKFDF